MSAEKRHARLARGWAPLETTQPDSSQSARTESPERAPKPGPTSPGVVHKGLLLSFPEFMDLILVGVGCHFSGFSSKLFSGFGHFPV